MCFSSGDLSSGLWLGVRYPDEIFDSGLYIFVFKLGVMVCLTVSSVLRVWVLSVRLLFQSRLPFYTLVHVGRVEIIELESSSVVETQRVHQALTTDRSVPSFLG